MRHASAKCVNLGAAAAARVTPLAARRGGRSAAAKAGMRGGAMNEQSAELPRAAPPDLKALIRRAKLDNAERSSVVAELRGAELARLELLRDALAPVFAQVPAEIELF